MKSDKEVTEVENNGENEEPDSDVEDQATMIKRLVEVLKYHNAKQMIIMVIQ